MSFMSQYNHTMDAKGRMIVPAKYREGLGDSFIVTRGIDTCLFVYDSEEWQKVMNKLSEARLTSDKVRKFTRYLVGGATEVELDSQGRILVPNYLREHASINKDVVLVGMGNHIEIWAREKYEETMDATDIEQLTNELDEAGIWLI
ncbi:MAG: division/cell wall cluster transcriptional repressor MraZ [Lachnospiraceae bacterium]|nr:division/cell wall cluster transcriptional repressor MraZ [Lachnospiraceae bacterium]